MATDSTRFEFGKNWRAYASQLSPRQIDFAVEALARLLATRDLSGKRFLDIGSGSGVHSLAALRLGAQEVVAIDVDKDSVATTRDVLQREGTNRSWQCHELSVFDLTPATFGTFDVVYSWGVLHHTGEMWRAIDQAAQVVNDDGTLALAIYLKTRFCGLWTWEKRFYTNHRWVQRPLIYAYAGLRLAREVLRGRNPAAFTRDYHALRGMTLYHDIHDWLGGYPYESATPEEIAQHLGDRGFQQRRAFNTKTPFGLFGSGCGEYVFDRRHS